MAVIEEQLWEGIEHAVHVPPALPVNGTPANEKLQSGSCRPSRLS